MKLTFGRNYKFPVNNLYVCEIHKNLCSYPKGEPYVTKILYYHDSNFIDPLSGEILFHFVDNMFDEYLNYEKDIYLHKIIKKVESLKNVYYSGKKELTYKQITDLNKAYV